MGTNSRYTRNYLLHVKFSSLYGENAMIFNNFFCAYLLFKSFASNSR